MNDRFRTPSLSFAAHLYHRKKAKLLRIERDPERPRAVFVFDCAPEQGFALEMEFQKSQDCKLFGVRDSLLDRAIRVTRDTEDGHAKA